MSKLERRHNWKENLGAAARARSKKRKEIITTLDEIREHLSRVDVRSNKYDELIAQRAELKAKLATI